MAAHLATHSIADPKVVKHLPGILVDQAVGLYLVKKDYCIHVIKNTAEGKYVSECENTDCTNTKDIAV